MLIPRIRGGYSDRNNINKINTEIQKDDLDERTRNRIINWFDDLLNNYSYYNDDFKNYIYKEIFILTDDDIPLYKDTFRKEIVSSISKQWEMDNIFTFLEGIIPFCERVYYYNIEKDLNEIFEEECVGYRFVEGKIIDVIEQEEIDEIEEAMNCKYSSCKNNIKKAMNHLYNREKPDYENSVKESILAVEGMCNIILKTENVTLGKALKQLEKNGVIIHPSLKESFIKIYGYTSDAGGIRHSGGIDNNTTFEEAKFMLVTCSAFLNYLIAIYENNP